MTIRRFLLLASLLVLVLPAAALAAPTAVDVRIEGKSSTIFFGPVTTDGKVITTDSGGTHPCDGSNASPPVGPGPTPTSALDDAAIKGGFTWDGPWFGTDFFASRIADESENPPSEFWGVFVNGAMLAVGGCQHILKANDEVLWAYDAFSMAGALKLTAPANAKTGDPVDIRVTDRATGAPIAAASVGSAATAADGTATLLFDDPGVYTLKADKDGYIRSREVRVCIDPPLVEACTSSDRTAPTVRIDVPAVSSSIARFGFIRLSWQGDDGDGSGIRRYNVERRRVDRPDSPWRRVLTDTRRTEVRLPARDGTASEFRVQAIDRAGNASGWATAASLMPIDNLDGRIRFSKRGWATLKRHGAFKRSVNRSRGRGASARLRFGGTAALIVTRDLPRGGWLRIAVDGESRLVRLRGRGRFRQRLVRTGKLEPGTHVLRVRSVGPRPVEIDGIAIRP